MLEFLFEDLYNWNTWWYTQRVEAPLGLLAWGSNPYVYAPDGTSMSTKGGGGGADGSGLDNGPMYQVPWNETGLFVQDAYDAGLMGLYLMDCKAQADIAEMIGRTDAARVLRDRFNDMAEKLNRVLWNETEGFWQNRLSKDLSIVPHMAPTSLYPLLAGPNGGPSENQAALVIQKHLTNPTRFAVWPSGSAPSEPKVAPEGSRPLIQWFSELDDRGFPILGSPHVLCGQPNCSAHFSVGNFVQRCHGKVRYEATALFSGGSGRIPLFDYRCQNTSRGQPIDYVLGPAEWNTSWGQCSRFDGNDWAEGPAMFVSPQPEKGLIALEMWWVTLDGC